MMMMINDFKTKILILLPIVTFAIRLGSYLMKNNSFLLIRGGFFIIVVFDKSI